MRILLPPSEGKTPAFAGPQLSLDALSFPGLTPTRAAVLNTLVELCRSDPGAALAALGLGPNLAAAVAGNARLPESICAPAWQVYSGVLFNALDYGSLPTTSPPTENPLLIASALFGLLNPADPIPAYRLSGAVTLPGLVSPRRLWSAPLRAVLGDLAQQHLIVDMRSQTYAAWCTLPSPQWVAVRVMTLRNGRPVPVSHHNKVTKGQLARALVASGEDAADANGLLDLIRAAGWPANLGQGGTVEVLTTQ